MYFVKCKILQGRCGTTDDFKLIPEGFPTNPVFSCPVNMYPRMTSFSDPKGFIQTVTMFHIKAEFLC